MFFQSQLLKGIFPQERAPPTQSPPFEGQADVRTEPLRMATDAPGLFQARGGFSVRGKGPWPEAGPRGSTVPCSEDLTPRPHAPLQAREASPTFQARGGARAPGCGGTAGPTTPDVAVVPLAGEGRQA